MDKLKPILEQKFWILSGLCLILPIVGWWMATSAMSSEYAARKSAIDGAFNGIPSPGPNKNWTARVEALNKEEELKLTQTGDNLWANQLPLMTWPDVVRPGVEAVGYRGEIDAVARGDYRYVYEKELEETLKILSPFNPYDGTGLVDATLDLLPNLGYATMPNPPSAKEIWDVQEDIWLYRALFQAIANVNSPPGNPTLAASSIVDSKIKQVVYVELRGGTPGGGLKSGTTGTGMPGGAMPGGATAMPGMPMPPPGMGGSTGMGSMGGMGGNETPVASFDPTEQFGPDEDTSGGTTGGATGAPPLAGGATAMPTMPGGPGGMSMPGGMGGANVPRKRYITEDARYKTRGFYMEVVMDHQALPEFISELSDSPWPVRVIRVQAVDRDLSDVNAVALGGGGAGGPGMPGMMPGMGARPGAGGRGMSPMSGMRPQLGGRSGMAGDMEGRMTGGRGASPRMPMMGAVRPGATGAYPGATTGFGDGSTGGGVDLQVAMADPYLVDVAIAGVFTLYLPPPPPAGTPGMTGVPGAPGSTPAMPGAAAVTPGATAVTPGATTPATTAPTGNPAATPVTPADNGTAGESTPATAPPTTTPASEEPPATDATEATPPDTTAPPETETPPTTGEAPADDATPAGTATPAAPAATPGGTS